MSIRIYLVLVLAIVMGCKSKYGEERSHSLPIDSLVKESAADTFRSAVARTRRTINYTPKQLETFLDSIGKLDPSRMVLHVDSLIDGIFHRPVAMNVRLTDRDFTALKNGCRTGKLDVASAKRIFEFTDTTLLAQDSISLTFHSFDKKEFVFHEFAVSLEPLTACNECKLYFFSGNEMISKHDILNNYSFEVKHFRDDHGKNIVYYRPNFEHGSGIWWYNYFFYQYDGPTLRPVLNELQNVNLRSPWGSRVIWLESSILKTRPLTIKMVYHVELPDSTEQLVSVVNDSTTVTYSWDTASKTFKGQYPSKLTHAQTRSYYLLSDNEPLFINAYQKQLRRLMQGSKHERSVVLKYLNDVKNY